MMRERRARTDRRKGDRRAGNRRSVGIKVEEVEDRRKVPR
jgi:hypothetical protein